jgi:hypothetical protein
MDNEVRTEAGPFGIVGQDVLSSLAMGKIPAEETDTQKKIRKIASQFANFLVEKNRRYGSSATEPMRVFSKAKASDGILVRLDDKLSRIKNSDKLRKNDVSDLIGYLMLLCVANDWTSFDELLD